MRSVDAHLAACLALAAPPAARDLPLEALLGTVLAEDVVAAVELPPFANSAMDGYAVRFADVAAAAEASPAVLPVDQDLPAGAAGDRTVPAGAVARIMTGAPVPPGTDTVVPVEWTDGGTQQVVITRAPQRAGQYIRSAGEDVRRGDLVVAAGTRLTARHVALAAAVGRASLPVVPPPRVAVVSTGSELAAPGSPLRPGQVYESNAYGLVAACRALGAEAFRAGLVTDDPAALAEALADLSGTVDLVLTSGGVSAGAYEPVKQVFGGAPGHDGPAPGVVEFVKVAMQPGMPQGCGTLDPPAGSTRRTAIVTLPGNPVSALLSFEIFVRPMLRRMTSTPEERWSLPQVTATASVGWRSPPGKRQFVRAVLDGSAGALTVAPVGSSGSHLVAALARADCLAVVPEESTEVVPGDTLRCMVLDRDA